MADNLSPRNPAARLAYSAVPMIFALTVELAKVCADPNAAAASSLALPVAGALLAPFASVAGNVFAEGLSQQFFNRFNRPDILENGDLQTAVIDAVAAGALFLAGRARDEARPANAGIFSRLKHLFVERIVVETGGAKLNIELLEKIAATPAADWKRLVAALETEKDAELNLDAAEMAALFPKNLPGIFAIPAARFNEMNALDPQVWGKILRAVCRVRNISTSNDRTPQFTETIDRLAEFLTANFPEMLKHALVSRIDRDGKAYANLQLKMAGEILYYVRELHENQTDAADRLAGIAVSIETLRARLDGGLAAESRKFDDSLREIEKLVAENQNIIIDALAGIKDDTAAIREGVDNLNRKLEHVNIEPKKSFKGFNRSFPVYSEYFTGRVEALETLDEILENENQAAFYGTHGLGKTRTAIEYARRHREKFAYILFISATAGGFVNNAAFAGAEISGEIERATTLEAKYNLLIGHLEKHPGWLLIVDNVDDPAEVRGRIPKHFPGKVIYTSNRHAIKDVARIVPLLPMNDEEAALTMLRRRFADNAAGFDRLDAAERASLGRIVEKIGTLPIGLTLAGAFVAKYERSFTEYLVDYEAFEETTFRDFDLADYYGDAFLRGLTDTEKAEYKGVAGVFLLSHKRITTPRDDGDREKTLAAAIETLLDLSCFLAPDAVPEEIWTSALEKLDEKLFAAWQNPLDRIEIAQRLTQAAFFLRDETKKTSSTHRLILNILQKRLSDEEKRRLASLAVDVVNELFPDPEYKNWPTCDRLRKHAEAALACAHHLSIETRTAARLYNQIAYYIDDLAEYDQAIDYYKKAMAIDEKTIGKDHHVYATHLNNLANVYRSQGNYDEAIGLYKEALAIGEKTIGKEHPVYAIRLNNLANVTESQGNYAEAINLYKEALKIDEKTIGKEHSDYAAHLNNLAVVFEKQSNFEDAVRLFKKALSIVEKTIGKEHPNYARGLNNLAGVYRSQGKYNDAVKLFKKALKIDEKTVGKEHPSYATRLNNLALVYKSQGVYLDALDLFREALRIYINTLPENHPNIQIVRNSIEFCEKKLRGE